MVQDSNNMQRDSAVMALLDISTLESRVKALYKVIKVIGALTNPLIP